MMRDDGLPWEEKAGVSTPAGASWDGGMAKKLRDRRVCCFSLFTAVKLTIVLVYVAIGVLFYSYNEAKPCESDGCEERCEVFNDFKVWVALNFSGVRQCEERWTIIDALYFVIVTVSTVGYGDLYPQNLGSVVFTFFYMTIGVPAIFILICSLLNEATHRLIAAFH